MESGELIASRYRVGEPLTVEGRRAGFVATDEQGQGQVVLLDLDPIQAPALRPLVGLVHAHLAQVLAVVELQPGKPLLVAERVIGPALEEVLVEIGRETAIEAVRSTLRVADAVSVIHQAGGAHGLISPASLIVAPEGHPPPRLGFYPVRPTSSYRSPPRGPGGPPSEADDTWAIAGLLYEMLTGKRPPADGIPNVESLEQTGVTDAALREVLLHGLNVDPTRRAQDVTALKRELARWYVDQATADASTLAVHSSSPPPLPALGPGRSPAGVPVRRRLGRLSMLAGSALLIGLGASWAVSAFRPKKVIEVPVAPVDPEPSIATAAVSAQSIDLSEVPVTGEKEAATGNKMATCVAGYLPKDTFSENVPDFAWICSERDPREGGSKLRTAIVVSRRKDRMTDAMRIFGRLGWYEMAAYAVVYRGCCAEAPPLTLPEPATGCAQLAEALNHVGREALSERGVDEPLRVMAAAIECEVKANRAANYRRPGKPAAGEEEAFRELLKLIQSP
jgi:hypothetical protein